MAGRYQAYPAYKPSGVEWLGEVPADWSHAPLKYMALEENALFLDGDWIESKDLSDSGIRYVTTGNVGEGIYKEQGAGYISEKTFKKIDATEVFEGDILVSRLNAPIGRACVVPDLSNRIVTSVDNVVFRPDEMFHRPYVVYMLSSREYFSHTSNLARGATMQRISRGLLGNIRIAFPSLPEQTQIAAFLDHETAKIDALIAKQQRLIALLAEKRQAVISHAVTKGLNPDAPLRPSGIDWLGDVPEHWEIMKLKRVVSVKGGYAFSSESFTETGKKVIRIGDIDTRGNVSLENAKCIPSSTANQFDAYEVRNGHILMAMTGATIGKAGWYLDQAPALLNQRVGAFECDDNSISTRFFWYVLKSEGYQKYVTLTAFGGAQPNISDTQMLNYPFVLPELMAQEEISNFLDAENDRFDRLSDKAQSAITLLKERRTALISAAVTGKIDVRDWHPPHSNSDQDSQPPKDARP
nr:restriction endonuclease subunit S [uncultured Shimia sp.]